MTGPMTSGQHIDLFPIPCYCDEKIVVVFNAGTYSVLERSSRRSEMCYRDCYVTNLSKLRMVAVIRLEKQERSAVIMPQATKILFVDYSYMLDRIGYSKPYEESTKENFGTVDVYLYGDPVETPEGGIGRMLGAIHKSGKEEAITLTREDIDKITAETPDHLVYHFRFDINVVAPRMKTSII